MIRVIQFKRLVAEYMMRIQMSAPARAHKVDTKISRIVTLSFNKERTNLNKTFFKFIHTLKAYRAVLAINSSPNLKR